MPITLATSAALGSATLQPGGATALSGSSVLTLTCDILANQGASDGFGGYLDNWVVVSAAVTCTVVAKTTATGSDKTEGEKITSVGDYDFTMPDTTAIVPANRIRFNGFTFVIQESVIAIPNKASILVHARLVR